MLIKSSTYINPDLFDTLINELRSVINRVGITDLMPYRIETDGEPWSGSSDSSVHGMLYQDLHYIPIKEPEDTLDPFIDKEFKLASDIMDSMPGLSRSMIILIGPNSIVATHVDTYDLPAYHNSIDYNVLMGISVPSTNVADIGMKIGNININHSNNGTIIWDSQIPHSAWNHTDEWWVTAVAYINKETFKDA